MSASCGERVASFHVSLAQARSGLAVVCVGFHPSQNPIAHDFVPLFVGKRAPRKRRSNSSDRGEFQLSSPPSFSQPRSSHAAAPPNIHSGSNIVNVARSAGSDASSAACDLHDHRFRGLRCGFRLPPEEPGCVTSPVTDCTSPGQFCKAYSRLRFERSSRIAVSPLCRE